MSSHLWPPDDHAGNTPAEAKRPRSSCPSSSVIPPPGGGWGGGRSTDANLTQPVGEQLMLLRSGTDVGSSAGAHGCFQPPRSSLLPHLRPHLLPPATQALALRLFVLEQVRCLSGPLYYQIPQRPDLMHSQRSDIAAGSRRPLPSTTNQRPH